MKLDNDDYLIIKREKYDNLLRDYENLKNSMIRIEFRAIRTNGVVYDIYHKQDVSHEVTILKQINDDLSSKLDFFVKNEQELRDKYINEYLEYLKTAKKRRPAWYNIFFK